MWAQNLFSITLFLTGFMLGSLSSEKRSYSEVKVRKYLMNIHNVGVKFSDETLDLLRCRSTLLLFILTFIGVYFFNEFLNYLE